MLLRYLQDCFPSSILLFTHPLTMSLMLTEGLHSCGMAPLLVGPNEHPARIVGWLVSRRDNTWRFVRTLSSKRKDRRKGKSFPVCCLLYHEDEVVCSFCSICVLDQSLSLGRPARSSGVGWSLHILRLAVTVRKSLWRGFLKIIQKSRSLALTFPL